MTYYDDLRNSLDDARRVGWRDPLEQAFRFELVYRLLGEGSILDLGCGLGDFCGFLKSHDFRDHYHGIDLRHDFVVRAREKWGDHFEWGDARDFEGTFDWIVGIGATIGEGGNLDLADLLACARRCGGQGIFLVLEESSRFDPALVGILPENVHMRPLRGEALILTWADAPQVELKSVYDDVVRQVEAPPGERARLAFNAGLIDEARHQISEAGDDPLALIVSERIDKLTED